MEDQIQLEDSESEEEMDKDLGLMSEEPYYNEFEMFKDTNDIDKIGTCDILDELCLTINDKTAGSF